MLVSFGDCAVTGNVTALRNPLGTAMEVFRPVYLEHGDLNARVPDEPEIVPILLDRVSRFIGRAGGCVLTRLPTAGGPDQACGRRVAQWAGGGICPRRCSGLDKDS